MLEIHYNPKEHKEIMHACALALKKGKAVVFPTDTCYGLAVDALNVKAVKKLYTIKGRDFKKPVHVIVPSLGYAKKIVKWDKQATKLANKFLPGALTLVAKLKNQKSKIKIVSAGTGYAGIRMPNNKIALDLAKYLKKPITATSANVSGLPECYTAQEIINQFEHTKFKPDILLNVGTLPIRKPSTVVKIDGGNVEVLREGPVSGKQIRKVLTKVLSAK